MPDVVTHIEIAKPVLGGSTSLFAGMLLEYLGVTTPIFVAASFGAIMAVIMIKDITSIMIHQVEVPAGVVALFISLCGGIAACYGYRIIEPVVGIKFDQAPATALLAFILVYFLPVILDVIKNRLEGLKK